MKLLVVDASVAVKWYLPREGEALVEQAFALLDQHRSLSIQLIAPDFFLVEFANVLWKAARQRRIAPAAAAFAAREILDWEIGTFSSDRVLNSALSIALAHGRSVYDSLYVALAQSANTEMITADERLVNSLGSRFPVRWLGSF